MGNTTNYLWDYGLKGENPWFTRWESLWQSVDLELYKRSKDLYMQGHSLYGSDQAAADLHLYSTSHATKGKIYFGANSVYDEANDRLGLGTTSPATTLDVNGNIKVSNTILTGHGVHLVLQVGDAWGDGASLEVRNAFTTMMEVSPSGIIGNVYWKAGDGHPPWTPGYAFLNANGVGIGQVGTTDLAFYTNSAEQIRILANGKVGIGDAAPGELLDVAGNINATGVIKIDDVQVVSNRVIDDRCDDVINSGDATTDGVIDALRDAMIAHGLIAAP